MLSFVVHLRPGRPRDGAGVPAFGLGARELARDCHSRRTGWVWRAKGATDGSIIRPPGMQMKVAENA
jgi:hypothetical protein